MIWALYQCSTQFLEDFKCFYVYDWCLPFFQGLYIRKASVLSVKSTFKFKRQSEKDCKLLFLSGLRRIEVIILTNQYDHFCLLQSMCYFVELFIPDCHVGSFDLQAGIPGGLKH